VRKKTESLAKKPALVVIPLRMVKQFLRNEAPLPDLQETY
jgi:hypothetical protein